MLIKKRIFSGVVCEQEVYILPTVRRSGDRIMTPRIRFKSEEERARHRIEISRRLHVRLFNENFSPASLYSTLTLDDEHEVYTKAEMDRIAENYARRLKRACPNAYFHMYVGEGKTTQRWHLHMVSNGLTEEVIVNKWNNGVIRRIEKLRAHNRYNGVDHGADYTGLANYLFNHWKPQYGGKRWKATRNARRPIEEDPVECKRWYSIEHPPVAPKGYELVESAKTEYGFYRFKYIRKQGKSETLLPKPCRCVKNCDHSRCLKL